MQSKTGDSKMMKIGTVVRIKQTVARYGGLTGDIITVPPRVNDQLYVVHLHVNQRALLLNQNDLEVVPAEEGSTK